MNYHEEELTLYEFADRFLNVNDFKTPNEYDVNKMEVLGYDLLTKSKKYFPIKKFIVKNPVNYHYTDGILKGSATHRIIENNKDIFLENHKDFKKINKPIDIVDLEVENSHNYYASGRLNHNTEPGGYAVPFHSSVTIRLKRVGQVISGNDIIGITVEAKITKNRLAPPLRACRFNIYFDRGIDDLEGWFNTLVEKNYIDKPKRAQYCIFKLIPEYENFNELTSIIKLKNSENIREITDEHIDFKSSNWKNLLEEIPEFKEYVYWCLCEALILKYRPMDFTETELVEGDDEEEQGDVT